MIPLAALALAGCLAVSPASDRITAGELAAAIPGFAAPAPDAPVGFAPVPGVQRIFRVPELRRLAATLHWEVEPSADICIERPVSPPDPAKLLAAMRKSLPQANINILDFGRQLLPAGDLEFPVSGLRPNGDAALWMGYVQYAGRHRFTVWARVKAVVALTRVVASADLRPGEAISAAQVHIEPREEFPPPKPVVQSADEVIGKWPRAMVRAGTPIDVEILQSPKAVMRGDTVVVDVRDGTARLELEAKAEASGAIGEAVPILNPLSHKRFMARVEGKGRVSVDASAIGPNPKEKP